MSALGGNVTFMEGSTTLATISLDATGQAKFTTSSLAVGTHSITASYTSSDANVASAGGSVVIPTGSRSVTINILTGVQGVATLTLSAGGDATQLVVVVGSPPAALRPVITAPIVGVEIKK